jgi:cell division protein FtsB
LKKHWVLKLYMVKKKTVNFIIIIVAILLVVVVLVPTRERYRKQKEVELLQQTIDELLRENEALRQERALLEEDIEYLEEVAREELGLIREDEIIYRRDSEENNRRTR